MKKNKLLLLLLIPLLIEPVYARNIESFDYTKIMTVMFGSFFVIGIGIILYGKFGGGDSKETVYVEKQKNRIAGLTDDEKLDIEKEFDADSIFKILPTFSPKKFKDGTSTSMKLLLSSKSTKLPEEKKENFKDESLINENLDDLADINIEEFKILDFSEHEDKYLIKSLLVISHKIGKRKKDEKAYTLVSENPKEATDNLRCPYCGGKVKDQTKLRCNFCGSIYPPFKKVNNSKWVITKIEKIKTN